MPQGELAQVLRGVTDTSGGGEGRLLVGPETLDDAGVVRLEGSTALVQTVDFFPPVVDDPTLYGAIAAANALSDVYAMGGKPFTALTLAGFPEGFPTDWRDAILLGGFEKVHESGTILAGGHTVESEVQFGFSITGLVDPEKVLSNASARVGDLVYLTKPIGMGCMTTAAKLKKISWEELEPAALQMATLNNLAAGAMLAAGAHACTDVTGFGLVGHGLNVARASKLTLKITVADVPVFPGARDLARKGLFSGGAVRGMQSLDGEVAIASSLAEADVKLCFDAETSGGLLIFIAEKDAAALETALGDCGLPVHCLGTCVERGDRPLELS